MIPGALIGDIIGSTYESKKRRVKSKDFPLMSEFSRFTDDSVMTMAVAHTLMKWKKGSEINEAEFKQDIVENMREFGRKYAHVGYSNAFKEWIFSDDPKPYNAFTNGAAMKISPVAWYFDDLQTVEKFAEITVSVTHNHPEGIKGAQATAAAIFLARTGKSKDDIRSYITIRYGYDLNRTCDEIRPDYHFDVSCQGSVPEAIIAFLDSNSFEDAIRNAISLGGDSDTLASIAGAIAEGFYGVPAEIESIVRPVLDEFMMSEIERWNKALNAEDVTESTPVERVKNGITEMVFILDRSGSMTGLEDDTIGGFNSMIEKQKKEPGEAFVSTVLFDHEIDVIHDRVRLAEIPELTENEYFTRGSTALLDAMGSAINHIIKVHKRMKPEDVPENVMFVIITDGMENSSREYSKRKVKEMVEKEKSKYGWEFLFIGANMDAISEAGGLGISANRAVNYHSDRGGTGAAFRSMCYAVSSMRCASAMPDDWSAEIDADNDSRDDSGKKPSLIDLFRRKNKK